MEATPHRDTVTLVPNDGWDERVLICRCGPLVDVFLVRTERFVVLIDTLLNGETARALLDIARPHLDGRQLLVVNTHSDWDHAWGNQVFSGPQALHPAPIIGSARCAALLRSPETADGLLQMQQEEPGRFDDVVLTPPTITFDERLVIDGGDLTLHLFATPGHTPDHVSVLIPEISTLLAADAAELPFPMPRTADAMPQLRRSLTQLAALNAAQVYYCHARTTSGPSLLHKNIGYFDTVEAHCRAAHERGIALPEQDADLDTLIGLPLDNALYDGITSADLPPFFQDTHRTVIRQIWQHIL